MSEKSDFFNYNFLSANQDVYCDQNLDKLTTKLFIDMFWQTIQSGLISLQPSRAYYNKAIALN